MRAATTHGQSRAKMPKRENGVNFCCTIGDETEGQETGDLACPSLAGALSLSECGVHCPVTSFLQLSVAVEHVNMRTTGKKVVCV